MQLFDVWVFVKLPLLVFGFRSDNASQKYLERSIKLQKKFTAQIATKAKMFNFVMTLVLNTQIEIIFAIFNPNGLVL